MVHESKKKLTSVGGTTRERKGTAACLPFGYCALSLSPIEGEALCSPSGHLYSPEHVLQYLLERTEDMRLEAAAAAVHAEKEEGEQEKARNHEEAERVRAFVQNESSVASRADKAPAQVQAQEARERLLERMASRPIAPEEADHVYRDGMDRVSYWLPSSSDALTAAASAGLSASAAAALPSRAEAKAPGRDQAVGEKEDEEEEARAEQEEQEEEEEEEEEERGGEQQAVTTVDNEHGRGKSKSKSKNKDKSRKRKRSDRERKPAPPRPPSPVTGAPLRRKDLVRATLTRDEGADAGGDAVFICPCSRTQITTQPCVLLKPSGYIILESVARELAFPTSTCPITGKPFRRDRGDVIHIAAAGTAFAASGTVEGKRYRVTMR